MGISLATEVAMARVLLFLTACRDNYYRGTPSYCCPNVGGAPWWCNHIRPRYANDNL